MKKYERDPIAEAICEFRFEPGPEGWDLAVPGMLYDRVRSKFPKRRQSKTLELSINVTANPAQQTITQGDRLQFLSDDEKEYVHIGANLLSVHRLKPYAAWEQFLPTIRMAIDAYREVARPSGLNRVGLRYVNLIEFEEQTIDAEKFFDFYPFVGPRLPQVIGAISLSVQMPFSGKRDMLKLQMTQLPPSQFNQMIVSLDLDYFLGQARAIDIDEWEPWLIGAHDNVEDAFEGCIKDRLRYKFGEIKST